MATLGSLIVELRTNSARFEQGLNRANAKLSGIEKQAASAGRTLRNMFAGIGVGIGIGSVVNEIATFQKEMSVVQAVTGATSGGMDELTSKARELGASTAFSAAEAAQGMVALGQAGFSTDEILASIGDTLYLAAAGGLALGEAADIASNTLSQFGMAADETGRVADVFATAAASANTTVSAMGLAMEYAGPVSNSLGISLEETAASISVLSNAGIKGQKAGAGFRRVMSALIAPTSKADEVVRRLGIDLTDLTSVEGIFRQFASSGLTASDAVKIFGLEGAGIAMILTSMVDDLGMLNLKFMESAGSAERMARAMQNNLAGDFKALSSAASELMLATGDAGLASGLRTATQAFTELLRVVGGGASFAEISVQAQVMGIAFAAVGTAIGTYLISAIARAAQSTLAFFTILTAHPLVRVALAIGTVASALLLLGDESIKVGGVTGTVNDFIRVAWEQTSAYVMDVATIAYDWVKEQTTGAGDTTESVTSQIAGYWLQAQGMILAGAAGGINAFIGLYIGMDHAVRAVARGIVSAFADAFSTVKNLAVAWGKGVIDVLTLRGFTFSAFQDELQKAFVEPSAQVAGEIKQAFADAFSQDYVGNLAASANSVLAGVAGGVAESQRLDARADGVTASMNEAANNAKPPLLPRPPPLTPPSGESAGSDGSGTGKGSASGRTPKPPVDADLARIESEAARIAAAVQTPMDKYAEGLATLIQAYETTGSDGNRLLNQDQFNAYLQQLNLQLDQASTKTEETMSTMTEFAVQAARNMETAMGQFFFDTMQGRMGDLVGSFKGMIDRMVSEMLASQLMGLLFGGFGKDGSTDIGGWVGKGLDALFGGARATGGPVSANRAYIVGEKGPELFMPGGSGNIIPNHRLGGGGVNVYISTPDANSFRASEGQIAAQINRAVNRGRRNL